MLFVKGAFITIYAPIVDGQRWIKIFNFEILIINNVCWLYVTI